MHGGVIDRVLAQQGRQAQQTAQSAATAAPLSPGPDLASWRGCQGLNAFAERALRTAVVGTLEAPNLDGERDGPAEAGTVGDYASVVAVQT